MNKKNRRGNIVLNSIGYYYSFYKDEQENLHMLKFNENRILSESTQLKYKNVLEFAVNIDIDDTIYLICLLKNGNLIYSTLKNEEWTNKNIGKLNVKSNIIKQLNVVIIKNTAYILFAYSNLINKNICTLEMITGSDFDWTKKRIINVVTNDGNNPFSINQDSLGNIHFAYKSQEKNYSHIYYIFYNVYTQSWSKTPIKISNIDVENINPYLFVDTKDNVHILWYSHENLDFVLCYNRLASSGPNKYIWTEIELPIIKNIDYPTIMFETDNILVINYLSDQKLEFLTSKDLGLFWMKNNSLLLNTDVIWYVNYYSNTPKSHFLGKVCGCYCKIDNNILCYLSNDIQEDVVINPDNDKYTLEGDIEPPSINNDLEEEIANIKNKIEEMLVYINKIDTEISNLKDSSNKNKHIPLLDKLSNFFK